MRGSPKAQQCQARARSETAPFVGGQRPAEDAFHFCHHHMGFPVQVGVDVRDEVGLQAPELHRYSPEHPDSLR